MKKGTNKATKKSIQKASPLRTALQKESELLPLVLDGLGAVDNDHRAYFDIAIRNKFADSLNLDQALLIGHEQENRWDYLLGHTPSRKIIAVEPHSAKQDEISTVINKRKAAIQHLRDHLRDGSKVEKWLWVASGRVHFAKTEKVALQLIQNGIEFVGTRVTSKHLP